MNRRGMRIFWWSLVLCGLLLVSAVIAVSVGASALPLRAALEALLDARPSLERTILLSVRIPRVLLAVAIGGALSLAGVLLQGIFRNPLVEPYTLGISGGAALGVCAGLFLRLGLVSRFALAGMGFAGALAVVVLLYVLSSRRGMMQLHGLLLTGVMISFISSSLIMLIMAVARLEDLHGIIFWTMGSLDETAGVLIALMCAVSLLGLIASFWLSGSLNALALGEEAAAHLGVAVERTKRQVFCIASLLVGCSVAIGGIIGFVGLVVPHALRLLLGRDHRLLVVSSFCAGGAFLCLCDAVARTAIAPLELPVGVVTGIVGGAAFLFIFVRSYE